MQSLKFSLLAMSKKIWPTVSAYALLGCITALAAAFFKGWIPDELSTIVGAETASSILTILASSMLAVTTFSLSTMVSAYGSATSNVTPRATRLITEDKTTQNALSTFLGSFLFSLVGLIALNMGIYEGGGRFILFVATVGVVVLIVVTFIRWIERLTTLGRVNETNGLIEAAALKAIRQSARKPAFGCNPLQRLPETLPRKKTVKAERDGYVQHFDAQKLSALAEKNDTDVYVLATPGRYVAKGTEIALTTTLLPEESLETFGQCFTIADQRSFEHDPRFGLCVLAEVASRAMSPAINDPGTAIDIVIRIGRVLETYALEKKYTPAEFKRVWAPDTCVESLFQDAFNPIARDAASIFEVQARLQKTLVHLGGMGQEFREYAVKYSRIALRYSEANLFLEEDKEKLKRIAGALNI